MRYFLCNDPDIFFVSDEEHTVGFFRPLHEDDLKEKGHLFPGGKEPSAPLSLFNQATPERLQKLGPLVEVDYKLEPLEDRVPQEDTVSITRTEYEQLLEESRWLSALEAAGVDNWDGFEYAQDLMAEE